MSNAVSILSDEKARLESLNDYARRKLVEVSSGAIVQRPTKDQNGEERLVILI